MAFTPDPIFAPVAKQRPITPGGGPVAIRPQPGPLSPPVLIGPGPTMGPSAKPTITPMMKFAYDGGGDAGPAAPPPPPPPHPVAAPTAPDGMINGLPADGPGFVVPGFSTDANGNTIGLSGENAGNAVTGFVGATIGNEGNPNGPAPSGLPTGAGQPGVDPTTLQPPVAAAGGTSPDLTIDPVYQKQQALDEALMQKAASGELSQVKDLLLGYGSQTLAKSVLDKLLKDPRIASLMSPEDEQQFVAALSDNPDTSTSTLAQLARKFRTQETALTENYNRDNLFYSGHHAQALGDQSYGEQSDSGQARTGMLGALDRVLAAYGAAQDQAANNDLAGYQQAYDRALQEALSADTGAGTDTSNTPPSTSPAATVIGGNGSSSTGTPKKAAQAKPAQAKPAVAVVRPDDRAGPRGPGPFAPPRKKKQTVYSGRH